VRKNSIIVLSVVAAIIAIGLIVFFLGGTIAANAREHLSGMRF
jgi:hypothetical protein